MAAPCVVAGRGGGDGLLFCCGPWTQGGNWGGARHSSAEVGTQPPRLVHPHARTPFTPPPAPWTHLDKPDARPRQVALNGELPNPGVGVPPPRQRRRRRLLVPALLLLRRCQVLLGQAVQQGAHSADQVGHAAPADRAARGRGARGGEGRACWQVVCKHAPKQTQGSRH